MNVQTELHGPHAISAQERIDNTDTNLLNPCPACAAVLTCVRCLAIHSHDHLFFGANGLLRQSHAGPFSRYAIPRRHLKCIPVNLSQGRPTGHECTNLSLKTSMTLLRWLNLVLHLLIRTESSRAAQLGLLRVTRPLQFVILKPPGLCELLLEMVGATRTDLIGDVLALQRQVPRRVGCRQCRTVCLGLPCIQPSAFRCCVCATEYCLYHVHKCGCFRHKQKFMSLCSTCRDNRQVEVPRYVTPRCKLCFSSLYYVSAAGKRLCYQCARGFPDDQGALLHEYYCRLG